jgi:uncharacterized delta-60 repeat protein
MKKIFTLLLLAGSVFNSNAQTCYPIDTSFGTGGKAIGIDGVNNWPGTKNLIVQPDNKIIQFASNSNSEFIVIRYKADGKPDSSFGQNGKIAIPGGQTSFGALQSDGKIVIAGYTYDFAGYKKFLLLRIHSNGSLDNSFGGTGKVSPPLSSNHDEATSVAIQADGKIVAVGYSSSSCSNICNGMQFCVPLFTIVRYHSNGTPDASFGQNGIIAMGVGPYNSGKANSVVIQPDGRIVVAGEVHKYYCDDYYSGSTYSSGLIIARFNVDGSADASFGQGGQVIDSTTMMNCTSFAMQADGKYLSAGYNYVNSYTLSRYNNNGSIDNGFAQNIAQMNFHINSVAAMPNGKIMMAVRRQNSPYQFMIARLKNDGRFDSSFNLTGKMSVHVGSVPNSENVTTAIGFQGNSIIAGGYTFHYSSGGNFYSVLAVRVPDTLTGVAIEITPTGPIYPCQGSSAILNASVQGIYQWYKDGVLINGATDQFYNASAWGYYSVQVSNANGCGHSEPVLVSVNGLPVYITPAGSTQICQGDSVKLTTSEAGTAQWYLNGNPILNATDTILWAKVQGDYHVRVSGVNGCGTSSPIFVYVKPLKPPVFWNGSLLYTHIGYSGYQWFHNGIPIMNATGPSVQPLLPGLYKVVIADYTCDTVSDELDLNCLTVAVQKPVITWTNSQLKSTSGYISYQWYLNNNPITNGTSSSFTPQQTGIYNIKVTGQLSCTNTSEDFTLSCNEVGPSKPWISWDGVKFLTGPGYTGYQWYYNDTAINGATAISYTPQASQFGRYKVRASNLFNCSLFSVEKLNAQSAIITVGQTRFTFYPNPVNSSFYIDVVQTVPKMITAVMYDMSGRQLLYQQLKQGHNHVPANDFPSGLYHLEIRSGDYKKSMRLAVIR